MPDQRKQRADGKHTREAIVREAVSLATLDGLEGLSIGNLASALDMSKSGIYAHFGSKQDLQLATVDEAERIFQAEVIEPALAAAPGLGQLVAICDAFFDHLERRTFPGGCFFAGAVLEMGARPGPVKEQLADVSKRTLGADPPVHRHRTRTTRTPRRRGPRRTHVRAQRRHPRRQLQLRPPPRPQRLDMARNVVRRRLGITTTTGSRRQRTAPSRGTHKKPAKTATR